MSASRILVYFLWYLLAATVSMPAQADIHGSWTATPREDGVLQMQFAREHNFNGMPMAISAFSGLSEAQVASVSQTQVNFELRRDAGTIALEGVFKLREGAGHFTFRPNRGYFDQVKAMGVPLGAKYEDAEEPEERLFNLAVMDVSPAFIKSMQEAGYRVSLEQYATMRIFRVTPQLIEELRSLGYRDIDFDDLIATRVHKVTPDYIRQMRAASYDRLTMDQLVTTRIHAATPEFLQQMKELGYGSLAFDDLIAFRIHRVTPEFVRDLRALGYSNISADDLVAMRIHRVTPEYIRELKGVGYANIPVEKLIDMRIHGIDAKYISKMK